MKCLRCGQLHPVVAKTHPPARQPVSHAQDKTLQHVTAAAPRSARAGRCVFFHPPFRAIAKNSRKNSTRRWIGGCTRRGAPPRRKLQARVVSSTSSESTLEAAVLAYLEEHPRAMDSLGGIADWWIARQQIRVEIVALSRVLTKLVQQGVLERIASGEEELYRLKKDG